MATATETGTLICPFPEPVLDIASAVLLSWPDIEEGFAVETALDPAGPWTPSAATPCRQDGQIRVAVPTADGPRYFRLGKP